MAFTQVQSNSAAVNTGSASNIVTWTTPATAGNLLLIVVCSDDYRTTGGIPAGFTESTGCKQETFHGLYVWWAKAAGGETSATYTIGSASTSVWETYEYSGTDAAPYDISAGQLAQSAGISYTTPPLTPTAGSRLLAAVIGGSSGNGNFTGMSTWLNSFAAQLVVTNTKASGTRDIAGMATLTPTADGATGYSSGATYSQSASARSGIIISFKAATGGGSTVNGTAALSGAGSVTAAGTRIVTGSATLTGAGVLAASSGSTTAGTATLASAGQVSAGPKLIQPASATLAGAGSVSAGSTLIVPGVASLAASSTVAATGVLIQLAAANLTGAGSLAAASGSATNGSASLTATGAIAAAGVTARTGVAAIASAGSITAAGSVLIPGAASLAGTGSLAAALTVAFTGTADLVGVSSLTAGQTAGGGPRIVSRSASGRITSLTMGDRL